MLDRAYAAANWWLEGLWLGLPARARASLFTERTELIVRVAGAVATVIGRDTESVTVDTNDGNARDSVSQLLPAGQVPDVTLVPPRSFVLTRTLSFPVAVEDELRSVLEHELDRLTPFAIAEVAFDYRVRERNGGKLLVDLALMRRATLEELVASVERLGLRPTSVTVEDAQGRPALNLLPHRRRLRLPAAHLSMRPALALSAALLVVAALYLPLNRYDRVVAAQTVVVEAVRADAVAARARLSEQEAALAHGELLAARRSGYVPPIALLRDLTTQIPEHTWLSRLAIGRGEVHLQGESAAATELLQLLESTELLRDVQFESPVARSETAGKEQFTIVAKLARATP